MSNFEDVETKYNILLHRLDTLRARGIKDTDPELLKVKTSLRDLLELKKKNSTAIQKVVPRLTGIKTVALKSEPKNIGELLDTPAVEVLQNKYVMLGVALGLAALLYYYFKTFSVSKQVQQIKE